MHQLALWEFGADTEVTYLDWGTAPRRSSDDRRFRVKNLSTRYTAQQVKVEVSGEGSSQFYVSVDGINFAASVELGALAPMSVSATVWIRRVTPSTAPLETNQCDLTVSATSWS